MTTARPQVTLEEFARTTALLRAQTEQGAEPGATQRLLAGRGLDVAGWDGLQKHWNDCLEADVASGRHDRAIAFARAFRVERERIATEGLPALEDAPPEPIAPTHGAEAVAPPRPMASRVPARSPSIDETSTELRGLGPVLPLAFSEDAAPPEAFLAELRARSPQQAVRPADAADVNMTTAVRLEDLDLGRPDLPFEPRADAPPPRSARSFEVSPLSTDVGSTVAVRLGDLDLRAPSTPFVAPSSVVPTAPLPPSSLVPLTLEQYASLCAELSAAPTRRQEILFRYRVADEAALARLDAAWAGRLAASPGERVRYDGLVREFLLHLRTHGGGAGHGSPR